MPRKYSIKRKYWMILVLFLVAACQLSEDAAPEESNPEKDLLPLISWHIQYTGELDLDLAVDFYDLDLFDTPEESIAYLKERGVFVICYFSAGSYENWRPDATRYPDDVLGYALEDWPGERWLDIRQLTTISPIIENRMDLAVEKGCDGVDPDNIDGYENKTGFPLTGSDQLVFNKYLAQTAHERGLKIGLKNDVNQIQQLVEDFDWALNEECFTYQECDHLQPFLDLNKPVLVIEYDISPIDFCPEADQKGFSALHKNWDLGAYTTDCHQFSSR